MQLDEITDVPAAKLPCTGCRGVPREDRRPIHARFSSVGSLVGSIERVKSHALAKILHASMSPLPSVSAATDYLSSTAAGVPARVIERGNAPAKDATFAAIGLAVLSTVFFAMGDVAAKVLTGTLPAIEVTWLRYCVFCLVVVPTVVVARGTRAMHTPRPHLQIIRALAVAGSAVLFILGLGHLQVAEATAINFISPIFITALSIQLLGEKVGIRRWGAAAVGFLGVMLVVQPGGSAFQVAALLPICAALGGAVTAITTRQLSSEGPETTLAWTAVSGWPPDRFVPFNWHMPTTGEIGLAFVMGAFSTMGHWLVILAYRKAAASTIAPFTYIQLCSPACSALSFSARPGSHDPCWRDYYRSKWPLHRPP